VVKELRYSLVALLGILICLSPMCSATGSFTLHEYYPPENVTVNVIAGGGFPTGQTYCFRMIGGGPGWNYYAQSLNVMELVSPPSAEACAGTATSPRNQALRVCWDVPTGNFTDWFNYGVDMMMFGAYFTNETGNYTMEIDGRWRENTIIAAPFDEHFHLARKDQLNPGYMGGTTYCHDFYDYIVAGHLFMEEGVPFVDMKGGTLGKPIQPRDIEDFLSSSGRTEFVTSVNLFPNSTQKQSYYFPIFFGNWQDYKNYTVFRLPSNTFMYQVYGSMKFNDDSVYLSGEEYYDSTANEQYLENVGGAFVGYSNYPTYPTYYGNISIHGAYYADAPQFNPEPPWWLRTQPVNGHNTQWTARYTNMTQTIIEARGRFVHKIFRMVDNILLVNGPELAVNNDYDDESLGFYPYEITGAQGRVTTAYTTLENTVKNADLTKMLNPRNYYAAPFQYYWRWIVRRINDEFQNSTRITQFINSPLVEPWRFALYTYAKPGFQGEDWQAFYNELYELRLRVVDSVTGNPIPNAVLTIQDVNGSNCMSGKSIAYPTSGTEFHHLYAFDADFIEVTDPAAFTAGDYFKAGMEYFYVTSTNASGVFVTRGHFNTTPWGIQTVTSNGNGSDKIFGNAIYWAWANQTSNATGDFKEVRLLNRSMRVQSTDFVNNSWEMLCPDTSDPGCSPYGNYSEYAPFLITIKASGYNNFTTYYTPTRENYFTIGLSNATECPDCPSTTYETSGGVKLPIGWNAMPSCNNHCG